MNAPKTVQQLMHTAVVTATTQQTITEVAKMMSQQDVGFVPIIESNKKLVGVVTDRDLVIRGYAKGIVGATSIKEVLSAEPLTTTTPQTSIDDLTQQMGSHKVRRLPVIDNGVLVGVVTIGDVAVREPLTTQAAHALHEISQQTTSHL